MASSSWMLQAVVAFTLLVNFVYFFGRTESLLMDRSSSSPIAVVALEDEVNAATPGATLKEKFAMMATSIKEDVVLLEKSSPSPRPTPPVITPKPTPTAYIKPNRPLIHKDENLKSTSLGGSELWLPPSRALPRVYSDAKDWFWAFPKNVSSEEEFLNRTMFDSEQHPKGKCWRGGDYPSATCELCSLGHAGMDCYRNMHLMHEFKVVEDRRPLFSFPDVVKLWALGQTKPQGVKILMLGDSTTYYLLRALNCELRRRPHEVKWMDSRGEVMLSGITGMDHLRNSHMQLYETRFELRSLPGLTHMVLASRHPRLTTNRAVLESLLKPMDIILLNFGVWYNDKEEYRESLRRLFSLVLELGAGKILFWQGSPKQHHRYTKFSNETGVYSNRSPPRCGPHDRVRDDPATADPFNSIAFDVAREEGVDASWLSWFSKHLPCLPGSKLHVHFFPLAQISGPFWHNHFANSIDCTHMCWSPMYYQSYWDALYLAVNRSVCKPMNASPMRFNVPPLAVGKGAPRGEWFGASFASEMKKFGV